MSLTYAYYIVDQPGFIEQFCKNLDKPEMKCDGKCHLKDVVEKKTTKEKTPINLIAPEKITLFFDNNKNKILVFNSFKKGKHSNRYMNLYAFNKDLSLDRPPQV